MKKIILVIITLINVTQLLNAQLPTCRSEINLSQMQIQNPLRYQQFMNLETFTANNIANQNISNQRLINLNGVITIPVVVHVLHCGENIGEGRNISDAQIQSQIDVFNEDFRRLNLNRVNTPAAFLPVAADYGFEFRLACTDPNGASSNGIIRKKTDENNFCFKSNINNQLPDEESMGIKMSNLHGSDPWPTNRYLNIWVCDFNDGTLGYGTFPADFAARPNVDGIVIETRAMGRVGNVSAPNNGGRVGTHEIGHWLNLRHIWGDASCGDDFVPDTPPQQTSNFNCLTFPRQTVCNSTPNGEMFMNYMDYTNDECKNIFTNGQRQRGRALFANGGPRAAFIDNYFRLEPRTSTLFCNGRIRLTNPNCLPVTWSVLSGAATIISSNNIGATINSSASGTISIRATAGNYVSDQNFIVSQDAPQLGASYNNGITSGNPLLWYDVNNSNTTINGVCMGYGFPNNYIEGNPYGSSENLVTWSTPSNFPYNSGFTLFQQIGNKGYFSFNYFNPPTGYIQGTVSGCGTYSQLFAFKQINCNPTGGDPCDASKGVNYFTISPNPANDIINIGIGNKPPPIKCDRLKAINSNSGIIFSAVNIYNNLGTLVKSYKSKDTKTATIPIGNLITGNYIVEIIQGDYIEKQQIIVQK